jgi:hypothetical protein
MMETNLICKDDNRRKDIRAQGTNGLDYLEVSEDQTTLKVYFLGDGPQDLQVDNVQIKGGHRIRDIRVVDILITLADDPDEDDYLEVKVDKYGDYSTYTLCLVALDEDDRQTEEPYPGFDPRYFCLDFSFKVNCPSDLDCKTPEICPPEPRAEPEINYLAKDYASFRQLMFDRLAQIMPDWKERHVPDLGVALVELLAYTGDHLSYYQDAVATEAYLDTARQRISVRRHARLVDYQVHEGCNARAWICLETDEDRPLNPHDFYLITGKSLPVKGNILSQDDLVNIPVTQYEVFEPLLENIEDPIQLKEAHNRISFYTWGDQECCLPKGTRRATLKDAWVPIPDPDIDPSQEKTNPKAEELAVEDRERILQLEVGQVLIFEEVLGPRTGDPADADLTHRCAVRLTSVVPDVDPLYDQPVLEIEWAEEDAPPFPICISTTSDPPECEMLEDVSVACGNVILVDHGRRMAPEDLGCVPVDRTEAVCPDPCHPPEISYLPGKFSPHLKAPALTFHQPLFELAPASLLLTQDPRQALPWIRLHSFYDSDCEPDTPEPTLELENPADELPPDEYEEQTEEGRSSKEPEIEPEAATPPPNPEEETHWSPQLDLLSSYPDDPHFVAEMDDRRVTHLRFGDGELGKQPEAWSRFSAIYRVGNGPAGNVGAETISHLVFRNLMSGIGLKVRNPLPAQGGIAPESVEQVKLFAPHAFRRRLERAIIPDDYAQIVMRDFGDKIQRAAATLRWMGSWYEVLVAVDPKGSEVADSALLDEISGHLYRYRRMGHDLKVQAARYVPLLIKLRICVQEGFLRGHVKAALRAVFFNRKQSDGGLGFFHPDSLTFGEGIYLSKLVAAAQSVPGVESVTVLELERLYGGPDDEIANGILSLGPLEIARLDNDPGLPEYGRLILEMEGGR